LVDYQKGKLSQMLAIFSGAETLVVGLCKPSLALIKFYLEYQLAEKTSFVWHSPKSVDK
jgi:hypothetical protein